MKMKTLNVNGIDIVCHEDGSISRAHIRLGHEIKNKGSSTNGGYRTLCINKKRYLSHRIIASAFLGLKMHGSNKEVDHINGDKSDNSIDNLRLVSRSENLKGFQSTRKGATSKYRGVSMPKGRSSWIVHLNNKYLGSFKHEIDAAKAWDRAALIAGFSKESLNFNK